MKIKTDLFVSRECDDCDEVSRDADDHKNEAAGRGEQQQAFRIILEEVHFIQIQVRHIGTLIPSNTFPIPTAIMHARHSSTVIPLQMSL